MAYKKNDVNSEKKIKPVKEKKSEKKVSVKKLPGIFKKSYTEKKFKKHISDKLYIPDDKKFVTDLFKLSKDKKERDVLRIPLDSSFTKKEIKRLVVLSKEIKKNKGRIKVGSFLAVAIAITVVCVVVTVFKNPVTKFGIKSVMQSTFGAKCDIGSVNVEILGAHITVNNLAQASADEPMKNIFQFDKLDLDFNLTQLLRARFDAENIEITGIALGTERKNSGALPIKKKTAQEKEEKTDSTGFYKSLKEKMGSNSEKAKNSFETLFSMYDPNKISENLKNNIKSPTVAKEVEEELKQIIETWKNKPSELQQKVEALKASTAKLTSLNTSKISNVTEISALLKEIESSTKEIKNVKSDIENSVLSFGDDQKKVNALKKKLDDAIQNDKNLLQTQVAIFDISEVKNTISNTLDEASYAMLGKYYPYLKQLISYAGAMKGTGKSDSEEVKKNIKKAKETAKKESKRYVGRNVYWKADKVPSFLIEKLHGSGVGIEVKATNISNDMNKRGEPWIISGKYNQKTVLHNVNLVVDARSNISDPLIQCSYSGENFPLLLDFSKNIDSAGMPIFDGVSTISAKLVADSDFSFSGSGSMNMDPVKVTSKPLSSEIAERIYSQALTSVNSLDLQAKVGFSEKNGVDLNLSTNFDKILSNAINVVANKELENVKSAAMEKISKQIGGSTDGANELFSKFDNISSQINSSKSSVNDISKIIDTKKSEISKQLKKSMPDKVSNSISEKTGSTIKNLLKK